PTCDGRARARIAGEDRRSADLFRPELKRESVAANHSACCRKSISLLGAGHASSDRRFHLSKTGRSPPGRFGWWHFRRFEWRLLGRGDCASGTKGHRRWFASPVVV